MLTNNVFPAELLPALRRSCHSALCAPGVLLPKYDLDDDSDNAKRIKAADVKIDKQLNKDVLDKCCAFIVYSEAETKSNVPENDASKGNEGVLLRGGVTNTLNNIAQLTIYSQTAHLVYQLGDLLITHMNQKAQRRDEFRYFALMERQGSFNEDVNAWVSVYKVKVQLQPKYEES